jgi:hypothetical protein
MTPRAINKLYSATHPATNKQYSTSSHKQHSTQPAIKQYSTQPAKQHNQQSIDNTHTSNHKQYSTQPAINNNK